MFIIEVFYIKVMHFKLVILSPVRKTLKLFNLFILSQHARKNIALNGTIYNEIM